MTYSSTKTYGHAVGLSCCFRQWRATSHCNKLHGYALSIRVEFETEILDSRNWVVDFGGLSTLKSVLRDVFDHKTLAAQDDPSIDWFRQSDEMGLLDLVVVDQVGCEAFAFLAYQIAQQWLDSQGPTLATVQIASVTVAEHGANSASFRP